jgi:hypothetical protein
VHGRANRRRAQYYCAHRVVAAHDLLRTGGGASSEGRQVGLGQIPLRNVGVEVVAREAVGKLQRVSTPASEFISLITPFDMDWDTVKSKQEKRVSRVCRRILPGGEERALCGGTRKSACSRPQSWCSCVAPLTVAHHHHHHRRRLFLRLLLLLLLGCTLCIVRDQNSPEAVMNSGRLKHISHLACRARSWQRTRR